MNYKYRVKGKVESAFILRGAFFPVGNIIEFHITESELEFVKERCNLSEVIDLDKSIETPKPIQKPTQVKTQTSQKAVKNELPKQPSSRTNKDEDTSKVLLSSTRRD